MEGNELRPYRPQVVTTNRAGEAEIVTAPQIAEKRETREIVWSEDTHTGLMLSPAGIANPKQESRT